MKRISYLALLFMVGCATPSPTAYWVKPGASQNEFRRDQTECEVSAVRDVPVRETVTPLYGSTTNCSRMLGDVNCTTTPGTAITTDDNQELRNRAVAVCLERRGWSLSTSPSRLSATTASGSETKSPELSWQWPVDPINTKNYKKSSQDGKDLGIDIFGNEGDPVYAVASGKVVYAGSGRLRGYGNLIVVKHSNEYNSVYAHNRKLLVREGDTVTKGQQIAEIGNSESDVPKLHFEIRKNSKPVDPLQFIASE